MFRHCGYGWPDQYGRWYRHRTPFGGLVSIAMTVAFIALAIRWWNGRRQPFTWLIPGYE
jgi:hypothetical protein